MHLSQGTIVGLSGFVLKEEARFADIWGWFVREELKMAVAWSDLSRWKDGNVN